MKKIRSGFISIIGRPNVGKSTLLNKLLGDKLSIVSPKANTTKTSIKAIKIGENYRLAFIDTPGINNQKGKSNKLMAKDTYNSLSMADVILFITEPSKKFPSVNSYLINLVNNIKTTKFLLINKMDKHSQEDIINEANGLHQKCNFKHIIPVSALKKRNLEKLLGLIIENLPEVEKKTDEVDNSYADHKFLVEEFVREQIYTQLNGEIPYDTSIVCEKLDSKKGNLIYANVVIIVGRESQKKIVIGINGRKIKQIGVIARKNIEKSLGLKVYLALWVKIQNNLSAEHEFLKTGGLY